MFYRISLVEPGPFVTSFISNLKGVVSKVDLSTADQTSVQLMQSVTARMTELTANVGQKPEEIADTIKEILPSSKPHIRNLTNKHYGLEKANSKFFDLTGDKLVLESVGKTVLLRIKDFRSWDYEKCEGHNMEIAGA